MSEANKSPLKKESSRVIQPKSLLTIRNWGEPNWKQKYKKWFTNTKVTIKENVVNTATQNTQNSNDKSESDTSDMRKLPVTVKLGDSMVKYIKGWKCQVVLVELW